MDRSIDRRTFVQQSAAVTGVAVVAGTVKSAPLGSNDRIRLGIIGVGNRGDQLLDAFLPHRDCQFVAVCDVYEPYVHAAQRKLGGDVKLYRDYRSMLEQPDIDAVVIATPDHWHALQCIEACQAGKDVYVEKPLSLAIGEGREMVNVANDTKRVTQVGLHRRSSDVYREAVERIQSGEIGQVVAAESFHLTNEGPMGIGNPADCDPPEGLDWDAWLGPAPMVPFNPNRCLYKFRWFWDYSGGQLTNMGTHFLDVIQWAIGKDAPRSVMSVGGKYAVDDNREIPDTMEVIWEYDGPTIAKFTQHNFNSARGTTPDWDFVFRGTTGTLGFIGNGYELIPEPVRTRPLPALSPIDRKQNSIDGRAVRSPEKSTKVGGENSTRDHARNFLDCVKSRKETNCPIETGHRSSSTTLLANIALQVGRTLSWDASLERVIDDDEANKMLVKEYRAPWKQVGAVS